MWRMAYTTRQIRTCPPIPINETSTRRTPGEYFIPEFTEQYTIRMIPIAIGRCGYEASPALDSHITRPSIYRSCRTMYLPSWKPMDSIYMLFNCPCYRPIFQI